TRRSSDLFAGQLGPRLPGHVGQVAVYIAVADAPVEILVTISCPFGSLQLCAQPTVGGVGGAVRQGNAGQGIQVAQAGARQPQVEIQSTEIQRIGEGASEADTGGAGADVRLQGKGQRRILQRQ